MHLTYEEFSLLNATANEGVRKYGGTADFTVHLENSSAGPTTTVTTTDPRLLEVWSYWLAEKTAAMVNAVDLDKLDEQSKAALRIAKSASLHLAEAKAGPIYDSTTVSGQIAEKEGKLTLVSETGALQLAGDKLPDFKLKTGDPVVLTGAIKTAGQLEVTKAIPRKVNTLEVFVMSKCPFGKRAEGNLIQFLRKNAGPQVPTLSVHYIFYRKQENGKDVYTSLHGAAEVDEDVVQMLIRDEHPAYFQDYLLKRTTDDRPWKEVAADLRMPADQIAALEEQTAKQRDALIREEYKYATENYGVTDGSPSFVWESLPIADLHTVPVFAALDLTKESCSG